MKKRKGKIRKLTQKKLSLDFFCILTKLWVNVLNNLNDFVVLNCYGYKEASCFFVFLLIFFSFRFYFVFFLFLGHYNRIKTC